MKNLFNGIVSFLALAAATAPAYGHYHILLIDKPTANRDEVVSFSFTFGHPFEHQMFATQKPANVTLVLPEGDVVEQIAKLERHEVPGVDGKPVPAFRWKFTPTHRGDHILMVRTNPVWMAEEKEFYQDSVKVILHVATQNGWDNTVGGGLEFVPLTRPYGLRAGTIFQAQLFGPPIANPNGTSRPLPKTLVEVEHYNPTPPKDLPPVEFITRTMKTDPNGLVTMILPESGWWALTAVREVGTLERTGKQFPLKVRTTLWVYIDGQIPSSPPK